MEDHDRTELNSTTMGYFYEDGQNLSYFYEDGQNFSYYYPEPIPDPTREIFATSAAFISIIGIIGNVLVILVTRNRLQGLQKTMGIFILNLSSADLLFLIFCVPFSVINFTLNDWNLGVVICKAVDFLIYLSMLASIFTLVAMSLDRFSAVVYPIKLLQLRSLYHAKVVVFVIWIVSTLCASPYLFLNDLKENESYPNTSYCTDIWKNANLRSSYYTFIFVIGYMLPLLLITCAYIMILGALWKTLRIMKGSRESSIARSKRKVTIMVSVVVLVFGICWLPHHLIYLWQSYGDFPYTIRTYRLKAVSLCFSYLNSCLNPIIYSIMSDNFRKAMRNTLQLCSGSRHTNAGSGPNRPTPGIRLTPVTPNNNFTPHQQNNTHEAHGRINPKRNMYRKRLKNFDQIQYMNGKPITW